jgi:hypothetical protein
MEIKEGLIVAGTATALLVGWITIAKAVNAAFVRAIAIHATPLVKELSDAIAKLSATVTVLTTSQQSTEMHLQNQDEKLIRLSVTAEQNGIILREHSEMLEQLKAERRHRDRARTPEAS